MYGLFSPLHSETRVESGFLICRYILIVCVCIYSWIFAYVCLQKSLGEHAEVPTGELGTRGLLSPGTNSMVAQLELKIKELKGWLRDTELFIFNLNLREDKRHHSHADASCDAHQAPMTDLQHNPQNHDQDPQAEPQVVKQLERFKVRAVERNRLE